jgi:tetratricopeptide (TPR) repeat protein
VASGRVVGIVALCAVAAVVAIVGGTLLLSRHESSTLPGAVTAPRPGKPVLELEFGLRRDAEALALARAQTLLDRDGQAAEAAEIFRRYSSTEARLGQAFADWTGPGSLAAVKAIAAAAPGSPAALLNLGWADFQAGRNADAASAWQQTASQFPDSPYAVDALDALHPNVAPGLPPIVVDLAAVPPKAVADLRAGVRFWDLKQVVSARQKLAAAARLAPKSAETQVAAAVARFSPGQPLAPFPHLGPLTAKYPRNPIVRLHLGVLLLWSRQVAKGKEQLRLAAAEAPASASAYAKQARLLLKALGQK